MSLDKQICRTCLATETELLSICAVISNDCRVIDYFNECLKISIINNDNLPQSICLSCLDNLLEVKKFHEKCIRSENYFKQQQQTNINNDICNDEWSINNKSRNQIKKEFINTEVFDAQKNYDESDAANEYFVEEIIEYEMLDNLDNTSNETQKIVEVETETESTTKNKHKAITESFYCIECNECFKYEKNYNLHIKSEHDIKNNENVRQQDDDDSKTIEFTENEAQNDMKKFRCELCGWFFSLKNKLEKHLEKNHANSNENTLTLKGESIRIQCSKCDRKFCTEKAVKRHYLAIHKNKNPNIHCPHCGNFQLSPEDLDHHLELGGCTEKVKKKIRIDKKKYNCKYCNKLFSHKDYCKTHERIHTGERPFKCQYCEKAFKQSSTLYTHLKLHTGKNISCTLCDKKFTRESVLKIHMRRHTEERPYVCELCPQNYTQKCHLQTHIQTAHSIEKPYKCDFCYMEFSRKDLFRIHIFTHIGKPYKCPECSVEYSVSYRFRKHLINVHGIYEDPSNFKRDIIYDPNTLREINDIMNEHNITTIQNEKN